MNLASPAQKLQDWTTQQWVIWGGRKIDPREAPWLMGPFGYLDGIGEEFIVQFARSENLVIDDSTNSKGLIPSMDKLNLPESEFSKLSRHIVDFYEHTSHYTLDFSVKWNPFFKLFGRLVNKLFSNRINQLNIPTRNFSDGELLNSKLVTLIDPISDQVKYTFWLRTAQSSGQVMYSGAYGLCALPSGKICVKAVSPLPNGNATVIMEPGVGANGELILDSSGEKFGDAGFYFLLQDSKGNYWARFVRSFRDRLIVSAQNDLISAEQTITLWHRRVLALNYSIKSSSR